MYTAKSMSGLKHGFLTRKGGESKGVFSSMNLAFNKGDSFENLHKNRANALKELGTPGLPLLLVRQVHGTNIVVADDPWEFAPHLLPQADGVITKNPECVLGVLTADCIPILMADRENGIIGAFHAGWRGALGGMVEKAVKNMEAQGANKSNIIAAMGPCIEQDSYEVGSEVKQHFVKNSARNDKFFKPSFKPKHHLFDMAGMVHDALSQQGLKSVERIAENTYTNEDEFFSCRRAFHRQEPTYGNTLSAISLQK
ncbi:MAG: peptidoglycan editing factor PgeF [Alphaproteobacteria bacterium]